MFDSPAGSFSLEVQRRRSSGGSGLTGLRAKWRPIRDAVGLGLAAGVVVDLDDHVGAPRAAIGRCRRGAGSAGCRVPSRRGRRGSRRRGRRSTCSPGPGRPRPACGPRPWCRRRPGCGGRPGGCPAGTRSPRCTRPRAGSSGRRSSGRCRRPRPGSRSRVPMSSDEVGAARASSRRGTSRAGRQVGGIALGGAGLGPGRRAWRCRRSESERSCLNFGPTLGAAFHGGIARSSTTAAMSSARLRACS